MVGDRVSLLSVEPDLASRIPRADLVLARRHLTARVASIGEGPVELGVGGPGRPPFAAIVLDGLLLREVTVMDQPAAQLVGPGDILGLEHGTGVLLPRSVSLTCAVPCRLGVLDDPVLLAFRRWPDVGAAFIERANEQLERVALQHAIGQLPRVHDRILATLWHLAERYGRVTPSGIHLPITLTHRLLGRLVGARRPTVSLALSELEGDGSIGRRADRTWLILRMPPDAVVPPEPPATTFPDLLAREHPLTPSRPHRSAAWSSGDRHELVATVARLRELHEHRSRTFADGLSRYRTTQQESRAARARAAAARRGAARPRSARSRVARPSG
jgi:CRP/FNR family cyclic AMP-dependent transcriptional regulator